MARTYAEHLPPVTVHLDTPSIARVYDYYLGGSNNWMVDREFGRRVLERYPLMRHIALVHRQFLSRVVRHLAGRGIHQFLDVGSGVPGQGATHHVADAFAVQQGRRRRSRVVYVDHDPVAVGHAEMLLRQTGDPRRHVMLEADLRDPENLWEQVIETEVFDLRQPVALLLIAVLHLQQLDIHGTEIGPDSARQLCERLPAGSFVAISHTTDDGVASDVSEALAGLKEIYDTTGSGNVTWRSRADIVAMLDGLEMLDPGWKSATEWYPEGVEPDGPQFRIPASSGRAVWAGVGRKPDA